MDITPNLTSYRRLGAVLFEEALQATGLPPGVLAARLREELNRPTLTAPTLRAWRRGNKAVPLAAFLAICRIANLQPGQFIARVTQEVRTDGDRELAALLVALSDGTVPTERSTGK